MNRELLQQALDALQIYSTASHKIQDAIKALKAELAKPEQDWSLLQATQESLREHMARIKELEAQLAPRQLLKLRQEAWKSVRDVYRDDPEVCFAMGFDAGYGAVASRVEPPQGECGGFDSRPAPLAQPEQEPKLTHAGANTNLRILSMEEQAALRSPLLFVHPPPRKPWVGLTSEDWENTPDTGKQGCERDAELFDWIEQTLKDKNEPSR